MTLDEIRDLPRETITPAEAAEVLRCDPHFIRVAARDCPDQLGFPTIRCGNRTKIPKRPFLRFMEGVSMSEQNPQPTPQ